MLKRELNLIERFVNSKTDATLALRKSPIGKRLVMFREYIEESTDELLIIDRKKEGIDFNLYTEEVKKRLINYCEVLINGSNIHRNRQG